MKIWRIGVAAMTFLTVSTLVAVTPASASLGLSASPTFPSSVAVGATGLPGSITLVPSCGSYASFRDCPPAAVDPGVFQLSTVGFGEAGTACAGVTFIISAVDATGKVQFASTSSPVVLPLAASCRIDFTFDVLMAPTKDAAPGPGVQTAQLASALGSVPGGVPGSGSSNSTTTVTGATSTFAPVSPARAWDTRVGPGPTGRIGPAGTRDVAVTGVAGVPATGVTAVVLNVTAVGPSAGTFVTAWPTGESRPLASNLNVPPGDTRPNLVIVKVGAGGNVSFYNDAGTIDLIADVAGWYGASGGQRYTAVSPARVWDTRVGPGPTGRIGAGGVRDVTVTGALGIPATGVSAVVLNVTAVGPSAGTFITAWPTGEGRPLASNLNIPPGDTRPNLVIVKVGAGGKVSFYNDAGTTDLIADVAGYYGATGSSLTSVSPARVWDTRVGPGPTGRVGAGGERNVVVTGVGNVPASGVTAVVLNVTAVAPSAGTFVTVWPTGEARPLASNLNVPPGDTRPNLVIVKVGSGGQVSFYNDAGTVDLIADVAGWYGPAGS